MRKLTVPDITERIQRRAEGYVDAEFMKDLNEAKATIEQLRAALEEIALTADNEANHTHLLPYVVASLARRAINPEAECDDLFAATERDAAATSCATCGAPYQVVRPGKIQPTCLCDYPEATDAEI